MSGMKIRIFFWVLVLSLSIGNSLLVFGMEQNECTITIHVKKDSYTIYEKSANPAKFNQFVQINPLNPCASSSLALQHGNQSELKIGDITFYVEEKKPTKINLLLYADSQTNLNDLLVFLKEEKFNFIRNIKLEAENDNLLISKEIIESVIRLNQLEILAFNRVEFDFFNFSWSNLKKLKLLELNEVFNINQYDIQKKKEASKHFDKLENFLKETRGNSLEILNLSNSDFLPKLRRTNETNKEYNDWCEGRIKTLSKLLASNSKLTHIIMGNSNLGPVFIQSFGENLTIDNKNIEVIDFSYNAVEAEEAAEFLEKIDEKRIVCTIYIKQKKFSIDELKDSWGRLRLDKYLSSNLSYLELKDNII